MTNAQYLSHAPDISLLQPVRRKIQLEGSRDGMSVRDYSSTIRDNIRKICQFYEKKCVGNRSTASEGRNIHQMSLEIQYELQKLEAWHDSDTIKQDLNLLKDKRDAISKQKEDEINQMKEQRGGLLFGKDSSKPLNRDIRERDFSEQRKYNEVFTSDDDISELSELSIRAIPIISGSSDPTVNMSNSEKEREDLKNASKSFIGLLRTNTNEKEQIIEELKTSLMDKRFQSYSPDNILKSKFQYQSSTRKSKHITWKRDAADSKLNGHLRKPQPWDLAVSRDTSAYLTRPFLHGQYEGAFGPGALFQLIKHS